MGFFGLVLLFALWGFFGGVYGFGGFVCVGFFCLGWGFFVVCFGVFLKNTQENCPKCLGRPTA